MGTDRGHIESETRGEATQDPTMTFISLDCLLEGYDMKLHTARGIMGLGLIPLVLVCNWTASRLLHPFT